MVCCCLEQHRRTHTHTHPNTQIQLILFVRGMLYIAFFPSMFQHSTMSLVLFYSHISEEQQNKEYKYFDKIHIHTRASSHAHKIAAAAAKTIANMKWKKNEIRSN